MNLQLQAGPFTPQIPLPHNPCDESATSFELAAALGQALALAEGHNVLRPGRIAFIAGYLTRDERLSIDEREALLFGGLLTPLARPESPGVGPQATLERRARAGQVCLQSLSFGPIAREALEYGFERWDGGGPGGLSRESASPAGRYLAAALYLADLIPSARPTLHREAELREEVILEGGHRLDPWIAAALSDRMKTDDFWAGLYQDRIYLRLPKLYDLTFAPLDANAVTADCLAIGRYATTATGGDLRSWEASVSLAQLAAGYLELSAVEKAAAVGAVALADWGRLGGGADPRALSEQLVGALPGLWRVQQALSALFGPDRGSVAAQVAQAARAAGAGSTAPPGRVSEIVGRCMADLRLKFLGEEGRRAA